MYTVTRTGRIADIVRDMGALVHSTVPLVTAKALTFTAQAAQRSIKADMARTFAGGATAYTLNSMRVDTATPQKLAARVAVKDQSTNGGTLPQDYLFPEVFGGARKEKRFERALRYAGIMAAGERAVVARGQAVDAHGNMPRGELARIIAAAKGASAPRRSARSKAAAPRALKKPYVQLRGRGVAGIWKRDAAGLHAVMIFVAKPPSYRKRLDFAAIAAATAAADFEPTFRRLLAKATAR